LTTFAKSNKVRIRSVTIERGCYNEYNDMEAGESNDGTTGRMFLLCGLWKNVAGI